MTPMVLTLVDAEGREWYAAAYVGPLQSNGREMDLADARDRGMVVKDFVVVTPPVPQGVDL